MEKRMIPRMSDDEIAGLEEEILSARYHLEGALCMIVDPYARGKLSQHLDHLAHSANKWLDVVIQEAANGTVPTVTSEQRAGQHSNDTCGKESASR